MHKLNIKTAKNDKQNKAKIIKYYCETNKKTIPPTEVSMTRQAFQV